MNAAATIPAAASAAPIDMVFIRAPRVPTIFLPHPAVVSTLIKAARTGYVAAVQVTL